jgi:putative transposase
VVSNLVSDHRYNEIQNPRKRKGIIDFDRLTGLLGFDTYEQLKNAHSKWIDSAIQDERAVNESNDRDEKWLQSIAVGSEAYGG